MILSRPSPDYRTLAERQATRASNFDSYTFYTSGRNALLAALNKLEIDEGACILLPAYICSSVTTTLKGSGYKIVYIDVDENLQIDSVVLQSMIEVHDLAAVLVVNYFGFSADIAQVVSVCRRHKVKVIEDCCHSCLTIDGLLPNNSNGDVSIFSFRKMLPVRGGGAFLYIDYVMMKSLSPWRVRGTAFIT